MENLVLFLDYIILLSFLPLLIFTIKGLITRTMIIGSVSLATIPFILIIGKSVVEIISINYVIDTTFSLSIYSIILNLAFIFLLIYYSFSYTIFNLNWSSSYKEEVSEYLKSRNLNYRWKGNSLLFSLNDVIIKVQFNFLFKTILLSRRSMKNLPQGLFLDVFSNYKNRKLRFELWLIFLGIGIYYYFSISNLFQ